MEEIHSMAMRRGNSETKQEAKCGRRRRWPYFWRVCDFNSYECIIEIVHLNAIASKQFGWRAQAHTIISQSGCLLSRVPHIHLKIEMKIYLIHLLFCLWIIFRFRRRLLLHHAE